MKRTIPDFTDADWRASNSNELRALIKANKPEGRHMKLEDLYGGASALPIYITYSCWARLPKAIANCYEEVVYRSMSGSSSYREYQLKEELL